MDQLKHYSKKLKIVVLITLSFSSLSAQTLLESNPKLLISAEVGRSALLGNSNLSPWGVHYRGEHKNGFIANLKTFYLLEKVWKVGAKYSYFSDSENYKIVNNLPVSDNATVHYIAPQIGVQRHITKRMIFGYAMGAGFARYHNKGLIESKEFKSISNGIAGNFDFTFDYILFGNLAVGLDLSLTGCNKFKKTTLNEYTSYPDKWNRMKFLRADFSLGIKGYF